MSERDLEAPEADAIDQDTRVVADEDDDTDLGAADLTERDIPLEVDPADLAEQQRSAGPGDEEYR